MSDFNKIVLSTLNDDHGVSEETYLLIVEWAEKNGIVLPDIDAVDGRFFIPQD